MAERIASEETATHTKAISALHGFISYEVAPHHSSPAVEQAQSPPAWTGHRNNTPGSNKNFWVNKQKFVKEKKALMSDLWGLSNFVTP